MQRLSLVEVSPLLEVIYIAEYIVEMGGCGRKVSPFLECLLSLVCKIGTLRQAFSLLVTKPYCKCVKIPTAAFG